MDILLIGGPGSFMRTLIDKLNKEGHHIFVLTEEKKKEHSFRKAFEIYRFSYEDACVGEVFESVKPDVVIFTGAHDSSFVWKEARKTAVSYSAGLMNILLSFLAIGKGRFLYLSSEEVFENNYGVLMSEGELPTAHTAKGRAIAMGEQMCMEYQRIQHADILILRLDHLYVVPEQIRELDNICAQMCLEALETGEITANGERRLCLLYAADAVEFIYQIAAADTHEETIYQISSGEPILETEIAQLIQKQWKEEVFIQEEKKKNTGVILSNQRFAQEFHLHIIHTPQKVVPQLVSEIRHHIGKFAPNAAKSKRFVERFKTSYKGLLYAALPFIENLICFLPFFMLNNRAVGSEYFSNIDFYLLYVLLFAIVYGQQQATFSSLLAVAGYCFRQMYQRSGFDVVLDYNTYIWIAQLLILGLAVGYMRDQLKAVKEEETQEVTYLSKQLDDISDINVSNVRVKEVLSNQIVNQNDSFGKIYEITSSLDKYEPEEVLFYAAEVLAKLMGSEDVAIYSVANRSYARLFSSTSPKARSLGNSIQYQQMTAMYEQLVEKKVYINKNMDEAYPLMANAIYAEDEMQLILMVWGIPWERMNLGQANMLTITGYLIQNAVLRANRYMSALEEQRYVQGTNILEEKAFTSLTKAYLTARAKRLTECTLVSVETGDKSQWALSEELKPMVRQTDYLGRLKDGKLYALLANTSISDAESVKKRFTEAGFVCEIQEDIAI